MIEPELDAIAGEILASISEEVPEYARPLEGSFGRGVRTGVTEALGQFVALIRDPAAGRERSREVYVALGRGELRQGRTLDSLQAAYRVGARVAWRRVAAAARDAGLDPEVLSVLAEAIFAYIDELSADSVEGYAQAQSEREGERQRRRRELVALLVAEPPADEAAVRQAAHAAGWSVPGSVAALACAASVSRLPPDTLVTELDGIVCAIVPDPDGPGRADELERSVKGVPAVLGPSGSSANLPASWTLAAATLRSVANEDRLLRADDHLTDLLVAGNVRLVDRIASLRLAPLDELTPKARARLEKTALAYVQHQGNAAAMARALHVHPQTARYRLAQLRKLLAESLDYPDARFELELALRARGVAVP